MSFMNSYKHLEKLCGEIMRDERRVSAYIDEMTCTPFGPSLVAGWNNDLKKLKHYRHIRNLLVIYNRYKRWSESRLSELPT